MDPNRKKLKKSLNHKSVEQRKLSLLEKLYTVNSFTIFSIVCILIYIQIVHRNSAPAVVFYGGLVFSIFVWVALGNYNYLFKIMTKENGHDTYFRPYSLFLLIFFIGLILYTGLIYGKHIKTHYLSAVSGIIVVCVLAYLLAIIGHMAWTSTPYHADKQ